MFRLLPGRALWKLCLMTAFFILPFAYWASAEARGNPHLQTCGRSGD